MTRVRRPAVTSEARRRNQEQLAGVGRQILAARVRRRWTQDELARRGGVSRALVSRLERGQGGGITIDALQRVTVAIGVRLRIDLSRDPQEGPSDAGHLVIQELILRLARGAGYGGTFELTTRPAEPWRSADVGLADNRRKRLVLVECWNTIGDVGAAARSSSRKQAETEAIATGRWGTDRPPVGMCWVVRATARNRSLIARYPEVFASRFPGSSVGWLRALTEGIVPPAEPGLLWCDIRATRLFAWRRLKLRPAAA
jgi:transcriptional regulator with XRE-family HTH domain